MSAAVFEERAEPGRAPSVALSAAVHVLLFAALLVGVRWQNRPPEIVSVELWSEPTPVARPEPAKPEPRVEPPPVPKPQPPPPPPIEKPDIALKEPPKPKAEPPKPKPKLEPAKPKPREDAELQQRMRQELAREQASFAAERERQLIREQFAREAAAAHERAISGWVDKVRAKIRGNIVLPQDIKGNPEAIFDVVQLPTGEVLTTKLRKSSGHRGYDEAVERAILKSSPLPKPDRPEDFSRNLELKFRPLD